MNPTPDQIANPVVTQRLSEGVVKPKVLSEGAENLFMLRPEKTVWGWDFGKPILDRLPFWSQAYNKGYEQGQAYVYYDPSVQRSWLGPGTCEVHTDVRAKHLLIVENGEVTFTGGTLGVDRLVVNIAKLAETQLNIQNGKFYIGYDLEIKFPEKKAAVVEGHSILLVTDKNLDKAALGYSATQEAPTREAFHAITTSDIEGSWRPEKLGRVESYNDGPSFYLDFQAPVYVDRFNIKSDRTARATSRCSVYYSDDGITWTYVIDQDPYAGDWDIDIDRDTRHRYWQLLFWDGVTSIEDISYTGEAFWIDKRVSAPVPIATPFIRGIYDDDNFLPTDKTEMILATVTVENSLIKNIVDNRKASKTKYEPVAEWLTDFQDANLRCRFNDVLNYARDFLSPKTAHLEYYKELEDSHCWGVGQFDLDGDPIEINLPKVVSLYDTYFDRVPNPYLCNNSYYLEDEWSLFNVDPECSPYYCIVNGGGTSISRFVQQPSPQEVDSDYYVPPLSFVDKPSGWVIMPGTQIRPHAINNLAEGVFQGDAVTKKQAYDTFAQLAILDNGNY